MPTFVPRGAGRPVRRWKAARFRIFYVYLDPLMGPLPHRAKIIEKRNEFGEVRASTTTCGPRLGFHGVASRQPPAHSLLSRRIGPGSRSPKNRGAHFVAAGQPCTGARILGLPSTPPGITRRRGGRSHRPVARTVGAVHPPTVTTGSAATADQAPALGTKQEHPDYAPAE